MKLTEITLNAWSLCNTLSRCFGLETENHRTEPLGETASSAPPATGLLGRAAAYRLRAELSQIKSLQEAGESSTHTFDEALAKATPSTLISLLRHVELPQALSPEQKLRIRYLLDQYHEDTLKGSPLIDANGAPIKFRVDPYKDLPQSVGSCKFSGHDMVNIVFTAKKWLKNYSAYREWQKEYLTIKEVEEKDVAPHAQALVGQQGVFSKQDIEYATPVCLFGGMLFDDPVDRKIDMHIRQLAGCDKYYMNVSSDNKVLEGMDISMKLNTALAADGSLPGDRERNNLNLVDIAIKRDNGEELSLAFLCANRQIKTGEHLCYFYGTGSSEYFSRIRQ